jgi:hypothetical protein
MTKRENMTKPFSFWHFLCKEEGHLNFYSSNKKLWFTCQRCGKNLENELVENNHNITGL